VTDRLSVYPPLALEPCPECGAQDARRLWRKRGSVIEVRACGACDHIWHAVPAARWICDKDGLRLQHLVADVDGPDGAA
jgi:Zn ribbon nucleic-acid-binding protein